MIIDKAKGLRLMSKWTIEYWVDKSGKGSVEKWLDALTKEQLKSVAKELKLLEICGNELKLPHSRSLSRGLFELRERRYGYRIYYGFYRDRIIILLEAGDKKTQKSDINLARERLAKLMNAREA
jgi:putative addiction module killer protein